MEKTTTWEQFVKQLEESLNTKDLAVFYQWPVIQGIIRAKDQWKMARHFLFSPFKFIRWLPALWEDWKGGTTPSQWLSISSPERIKSAYEWDLFLSRSQTNFSKLDSVYEFGGGSGMFAKIARKMGYRGSYTIYDLPVFSKIQSFFLKDFNIKLTNELETISPTLFVALWSLSETPVADRKKVLAKVTPAYFFIAFQDTFENGINNVAYFQELQKNNAYRWIEESSLIYPGNRYLIGIKRNTN